LKFPDNVKLYYEPSWSLEKEEYTQREYAVHIRSGETYTLEVGGKVKMTFAPEIRIQVEAIHNSEGQEIRTGANFKLSDS